MDVKKHCDLADVAINVARERGYTIPDYGYLSPLKIGIERVDQMGQYIGRDIGAIARKESLYNPPEFHHGDRERAKRLVPILMFIARVLWLRNGNQATQDEFIKKRLSKLFGKKKLTSLEGDRNVALILAGSAIHLINDAISFESDNKEFRRLDRIDCKEVERGFDDADENAWRKILNTIPEITAESAMRKAAYYTGLIIGYVVKDAPYIKNLSDRSLYRKYCVIRALYNILAPATISLCLYFTYLFVQPTVISVLSALLGTTVALSILKLIPKDRLAMRVKWAYGLPNEYVPLKER